MHALRAAMRDAERPFFFTLCGCSCGREAEMMPGALAAKNAVPIKKFAKIGRPGFRATKVREDIARTFLDGSGDG